MRNPYVTGAYVIGAKFYGREALLDHLTHSAGHAYWLIGTRRIGKTSTLRQLEAQALAHGQRIPVFWDMQGADTVARLGQYLADTVATYGPRFEPLGLSPTGLGEDALVILRSLRRAVLRAGRELLLLCDEAEALLRIAREEPVALQRLHRELTNGNGLRVVMASTRAIYQLHDLCADWPTSPFLEGFDLSQTLGGLTPAAVRRLATQAQALAGERVRAASATVEAVVEATNGHPYLAQVMCARLYQEDGALRPPTERDVAVEPMLRGFFSHDFNALTPSERATLLAVHRGEATGEATLLARGRRAGRCVAPRTRIGSVGLPAPGARSAGHRQSLPGALPVAAARIAGTNARGPRVRGRRAANADPPAGRSSRRPCLPTERPARPAGGVGGDPRA